MSRLLRRARKALSTEQTEALGKEVFRTRNRSVRRVAQRLHRIARRKGEQAKEDLKAAYQKLIAITQASCAGAERVVEALRSHAAGKSGGLMEKFEHFLPLVEQGIEQADRRVLRGERLPATEKLLSLFEEHTQIITRHKPGKPREFGRKIVLDEVDGGIISRYEVLPESASERSELSASLKAHQQCFGRAPYLLAGDGVSTRWRTREWPIRRGWSGWSCPRAESSPRREGTTRNTDGSAGASAFGRGSRGASAC